MAKQLTLLAMIKAKADQANGLGQRLAARVAPTRAESGCINYDLHRSNDDPSVWMPYENRRSPDDLEQHFQTAHFKKFQASRHEVLGDDRELRRFAMTTSQAPPKK